MTTIARSRRTQLTQEFFDFAVGLLTPTGSILDRLQEVDEIGNGVYLARCPGCCGDWQTLVVDERDESLYCAAQCTPEAIRQAAGGHP